MKTDCMNTSQRWYEANHLTAKTDTEMAQNQYLQLQSSKWQKNNDCKSSDSEEEESNGHLLGVSAIQSTLHRRGHTFSDAW